MQRLTTHQKLPTKWSEREILREKGQFWTPSWVAEAMAAYVSENADLIFDPATGKGAFYEALLNLKKSKVSFFGTDIDEKVLSSEIYKQKDCCVENRDFIKNPPQRKFRAIIANPPYIRHHRIDENTKILLKKLAVSVTGMQIDGRAGYHIYFFIQALNHLEKDGKLAIIMPADTCEGKFSTNLWKWISESFRIECVATFDEKATPFPNVDTNAIVLFIKNSKPRENFYWLKVNKSYSSDFFDFVSSNFQKTEFETLEITTRQVNEGVKTGLSRPRQNHDAFKYHLKDFANVMRGIATGSNEFFFLTAKQVKELQIPKEFLKRAVGRTKDIKNEVLTLKDVDKLEEENRPTYLLAINGCQKLPKAILDYLKFGEELELPNRSLIGQRKPWYKMEQRIAPPLLFAYLGRQKIRFIKNEAKVLPLTGFLCVYPNLDDAKSVNDLWEALNHPKTLENLRLVGKSYGSDSIKVEPGNLLKLPIPEIIVRDFRLESLNKLNETQLSLFT